MFLSRRPTGPWLLAGALCTAGQAPLVAQLISPEVVPEGMSTGAEGLAAVGDRDLPFADFGPLIRPQAGPNSDGVVWGLTPEGDTMRACADDSTFALLDFWVGSWNVYVGSQLAGTDHVEKVLDGCAITESWTAANGGTGHSLFYVHPADRRWRQVWVTARALAPGGVKEKTQLDPLPGGAIRFQGEIRDTTGRAWLDRTTLMPNPDGTVHQVIEMSTDGGTTWRATFDAVYRRES